jgi:hypothetical protein
MQAAVREHTVPGWTDLESELDAWHASGTRATFWWRDDDATRPGPQLEHLFSVAGKAPLALAVIPLEASDELAARVRNRDGVTVLQHGYAHTNHALTNEKKSEFGDNRPLATMMAEIEAGRNRLAALFGDRFVPVFVPPWNRVSAAIAGRLIGHGFRGLSTYGPRRRATARCTVNCHADLIDWRGSRGFVGEGEILAQIIDHLSARRRKTVDATEPTGLLTHHRDHDPACWQFIETFVRTIENHLGAAWTPIQKALSGAPQ